MIRLRHLVSFLGLLMILPVISQESRLDSYIKQGLESNQALRQKQLDHTKSLLALREAKGMFFPDVSLNARYTVADGGRVITFPIGDLLNPVYNTLNLLTASQQFPEVENQEFNFYRPKEHETKVSLRQPIYSSDIIGNVRIRKEYADISKVDVEIYKRHLVREIKTAYYNYQKAYSLAQLVDSTFALVNENLRVSQRLFENDLVTRDVVYRSESEISQVEVERARAKNMVEASRSYFNFLLNRPLNDPIETGTTASALPLISLEEAQQNAVSNREEMSQLTNYIQLNEHVLKLQQGSSTPDLFGAVDYGFQGEEYSFQADDDFVLASLVLQWNLFHGFTNRNKVKQTRIETEKLQSALDETAERIKMQVVNQYYAVITSHQAIEAASKQLRLTRKAFRITARKYAEGQASLLEYIDARTSFTTAQSNLVITKNDYSIQLAELEFAMAGAEINVYP